MHELHLTYLLEIVPSSPSKRIVRRRGLPVLRFSSGANLADLSVLMMVRRKRTASSGEGHDEAEDVREERKRGWWVGHNDEGSPVPSQSGEWPAFSIISHALLITD